MQTLQEKKTVSATETDASKTLFIFNPEHDFALAVGNGPYTPPAEIILLKKKLSLLPATYAADSDFILIPDDTSADFIDNSPYIKLVEEKNLRLVDLRQISSNFKEINKIIPWGWDHNIRRMLLENGAPESLVPSEENIENIRRLSHRRTTIPFKETISQFLGENVKLPSKELFSIEEVEEYLKFHSPSFFKAPWSSSGRGIVVSDHISRKGLLEWAHGMIRRQGSVIAEPAWKKSMDFATEWIVSDGQPVFLGFSVFEASSRGKYHGNIDGSQSDLHRMIIKGAPAMTLEVLEAQKFAIQKHISPHYNGPLGIDMLADTDGNINYCVEINLRLTMGHIFLKNSKNILLL